MPVMDGFTATTMAIVAVFLPVGVMSGISGQFFKSFGLTVVISVLLSLAVARLITPMVAAYFLKAEGAQPHGDAKWISAYMAVLRWSLRHRWWTVGIAGGAFLATILAFATLPLTFQPPLNLNSSQVHIDMTPGSTLDQTANVAEQASKILRRQPEVSAAFAEINVGNANIYVTLNPKRKRTSTEFERALAPEMRQIPDARINFQSQSGGNGRDITFMLAGDDPQLLYTHALKIVGEMSKLKELRAVRIDGDTPRPEITIHPRFDLAADMGVTTAALSQTIRIATLGDIDQNVAKFSLSDRQIPIRVSIDEDSRRNLSTIQNLPVPTTRGGSVPLKVVADINFGAGPSQLRRQNQNRRIVIGADLAPGVVEAQSLINKLPSVVHLPAGVNRVKIGQEKFMSQLFLNFAVAVVSGIMLVFAVLVLLYRRVLPPMVNMGSLLLAPLGGALALHLTGNAISMPVLIGLLMLFGIVAKNSILLVDFALEEMDKGVPKLEAIIDAGHKRAQPIVMTTVAMVAGMLPIALSLTGDGSWRAPMGITVIGGLVLSTLLTLVIVPASFSLAVGFERRLGGWLGRKLIVGGKGGPVPNAHPAE
jgi:multidrug efflux pump subunit AcrB